MWHVENDWWTQILLFYGRAPQERWTQTLLCSSSKPLVTAGVTNKNWAGLWTRTCRSVRQPIDTSRLGYRSGVVFRSGADGGSHVQEQHPGVLYHWLDLAQEGDRFSPVNQTVVVRQGDVHHGTDLHLTERELLRARSETFYSYFNSSESKPFHRWPQAGQRCHACLRWPTVGD